MAEAATVAGFPVPTRHHAGGPQSVTSGSAVWLSPERIAETRRVWSRAYGRVLSDTEAVEILANVRRLAEVLLIAHEEQQTHECHHLGPGLFP